jgi:hypothetical protein
MVKGRIRVKSDYIKYRVYICDHGTEMRPRWGKLDFEFVAFSVLYYIKKVITLNTNGLQHFMVEILGSVCGCGSLVLA